MCGKGGTFFNTLCKCLFFLNRINLFSLEIWILKKKCRHFFHRLGLAISYLIFDINNKHGGKLCNRTKKSFPMNFGSPCPPYKAFGQHCVCIHTRDVLLTILLLIYSNAMLCFCICKWVFFLHFFRVLGWPINLARKKFNMESSWMAVTYSVVEMHHVWYAFATILCSKWSFSS